MGISDDVDHKAEGYRGAVSEGEESVGAFGPISCMNSTEPMVFTDGDVLVVWKLDRLGRSLTHLIEIVNTLKANKSPSGR